MTHFHKILLFSSCFLIIVSIGVFKIFHVFHTQPTSATFNIRVLDSYFDPSHTTQIICDAKVFKVPENYLSAPKLNIFWTTPGTTGEVLWIAYLFPASYNNSKTTLSSNISKGTLITMQARPSGAANMLLVSQLEIPKYPNEVHASDLEDLRLCWLSSIPERVKFMSVDFTYEGK